MKEVRTIKDLDGELIGVGDAIKESGLTRDTFDYWARKGEGPPFQRLDGTGRVFLRMDVIAWKNRMTGKVGIMSAKQRRKRGKAG